LHRCACRIWRILYAKVLLPCARSFDVANVYRTRHRQSTWSALAPCARFGFPCVYTGLIVNLMGCVLQCVCPCDACHSLYWPCRSYNLCLVHNLPHKHNRIPYSVHESSAQTGPQWIWIGHGLESGCNIAISHRIYQLSMSYHYQ
jgi:hypothetical protein